MCVAMLPVWFAVLLANALPWLALALDCELLDPTRAQCPAHALVRLLDDPQTPLVWLALMTTPVAVMIFFACRAFARRKLARQGTTPAA